MVVIFVSFGMQKFTLQSAQGIVQFISNSPFISWLSVFGFKGRSVCPRCCRVWYRRAACGRRVQPDPVSGRFANGRSHFCDYLVFFLHNARGCEVEFVDRPDGLELDRRVHIQGHRFTLCLCRVVPGLLAAIRCPITHRLTPFLAPLDLKRGSCGGRGPAIADVHGADQ